MSLSPAERIVKLIEESDCPYIQVSEIPEDQRIDLDGLRALSEEMKDRIHRNDVARAQSAKSASEFFVS